MAIMAKGKIGLYELVVGLISFMTLPTIYFFVRSPLGVYGVGVAFIVSYGLLSVVRALFSRSLVGMSLIYWVTKVVAPILSILAISSMAGFLIRTNFEVSFVRLAFTCCATLISNLVFGYWFVLSREERDFICDRVSKRLMHINK